MRRVLAGMMFAACLLQAGMIDIDSKPGLANTLTGATVTIGIHPAWQTNNPQNPGDIADTSAVWISYAATGFDGSVLQLPEGQTAVASIFHSFTSGTGGFQLLVWADDSTQVFMDNVLLTHAESYPIGFAPDRFGTFAEALTAGSHTLDFRLFQQGPDFNARQPLRVAVHRHCSFSRPRTGHTRSNAGGRGLAATRQNAFLQKLTTVERRRAALKPNEEPALGKSRRLETLQCALPVIRTVSAVRNQAARFCSSPTGDCVGKMALAPVREISARLLTRVTRYLQKGINHSRAWFAPTPVSRHSAFDVRRGIQSVCPQY